MEKVKRIIAHIVFSSEDSNNTVVVDDNLISAYFEDLDGDSSNLIDFGIYANRGSLEFVDRDNVFKLLSDTPDISSVKVEFYFAKNTISKIKTLIIDDIDINEETNVVKLSLVSRYIKWQEITIPQIYMFSQEHIRLTSLINEVNEYLGEDDLKLNIDDFYLNAFSTLWIYCPYIEPTNAWDVISKICVVCGGRIYEDVDGNPYIYSFFTLSTLDTIVIEPRHILSISNFNPRYKNRNNQNRPVSIICKNRTKNFQKVYGSVEYKIYSYVPDESVEYTEYTATRESQNPNVTATRLDLFYTQLVFQLKPNNPLYQHRKLTAKGNFYAHAYTGPNIYHTTEGNVTIQNANINVIPWSNTVIVNTEIRSRTGADGAYDRSYLMDGIIYGLGDFYSDGEDKQNTYTIVPFPSMPPIELTTNELFQTQNRRGGNGTYQDHSSMYLQLVHRRFNSETLECECIADDYYNSDETLVLPFGDKQMKPFSRKYMVEPYVIRNGERVPFMKGDYSSPTYNITGIKYSYSGLIRQTLYLRSKLI